MREKILGKPQTFLFAFYCTKRRCSQIKPQLKIDWDSYYKLINY